MTTLQEQLREMEAWTLPEGTSEQQRIVSEYQVAVGQAADALEKAEAERDALRLERDAEE